MFHFKGNLLSRLTKHVELSHKWVLTNLKCQETLFYSILFHESKEGTSEVPPFRIKVVRIIKQFLVLLNCVFGVDQ